MVINKLEMYMGDIKTSISFNENTNILNVLENQYGKTTIVYSILYCLGLEYKIFNRMSKKPTLVKLYFNESIIARSKSFWTLNEKKIKSSKDFSEHFDQIFPNARMSTGYAPIKVAELMEYTTLIQRREAKKSSNIWPNMMLPRNKDIERFMSGGDYNSYQSLSEEIFKIDKNNKKIKRNYHLDNYIKSNNVNELEDFIDFEKEIDKAREKIKLLNSKFRKNRVIIRKFKTEVDYNKEIEQFSDGIESLDSLKMLEDKTELREYISNKFNLSTQKSVSISEYEMAVEENEGLLNEINKMEREISLIEKKSYDRVEDSNLKSKIITYALAKVSKEDIVLVDEQKTELDKLSKNLDDLIKQFAEESAKTLNSFDIKLADSGIGQVALFLINAMKFAEITNLPIIIDSADEVFSTIEKISDAEMHEIINIIGKSNLQIILTTTKIEYSTKTKNKVINIDKKILENSGDYKVGF